MNAIETITSAQIFWSTPLGLFISLSLFICYTINVTHPGIDDCLSDRVYYSCVALVAFLAFVSGIDPIKQHTSNITQTILLLLAIRAPWRLAVRMMRYWRTKQPQATATQFKMARGKTHVKTR